MLGLEKIVLWGQRAGGAGEWVQRPIAGAQVSRDGLLRGTGLDVSVTDGGDGDWGVV